MARHRSPKGRRAHLGPPLSAACGGSGGRWRPPVDHPSSSSTSSTPARASSPPPWPAARWPRPAQHAARPRRSLSSPTVPRCAGRRGAPRRRGRSRRRRQLRSTSPMRLRPRRSHRWSPRPSPTCPPTSAVADAASLVKAADLQRAAAEAEAAAAAARRPRRPGPPRPPAPQRRPRPRRLRAPRWRRRAVPSRWSPAACTSGFGARCGPAHQGLDIAAPIGTPIRAPLAGTVIDSGPASGFGLWVRVRHADGTITTYGHINRSFVRVGQQVAAGEVIAEVGNRGQSTGPHLHIEVTTPSGNEDQPAARGWTSTGSADSSRRCSHRSTPPRARLSRPPTASARERVQRADLVGHVQRGHLVRLGQRRVVEHGVDEVVDGAAAAHDRLPDVHEVGGAGAEHVHARAACGRRWRRAA